MHLYLLAFAYLATAATATKQWDLESEPNFLIVKRSVHKKDYPSEPTLNSIVSKKAFEDEPNFLIVKKSKRGPANLKGRAEIRGFESLAKSGISPDIYRHLTPGPVSVGGRGQRWSSGDHFYSNAESYPSALKQISEYFNKLAESNSLRCFSEDTVKHLQDARAYFAESARLRREQLKNPKKGDFGHLFFSQRIDELTSSLDKVLHKMKTKPIGLSPAAMALYESSESASVPSTEPKVEDESTSKRSDIKLKGVDSDSDDWVIL